MSALYPAGAEGLVLGDISWPNGSIKAALVRGYTYSASHRYVSDVTAAGGVGNGLSPALTGKTAALGVLDAADTTATTAASAADHGILLFQSSGPAGGADVAATAQRLIAWIDTGTGLPIQPGAGSTPIVWDSGSDRILRIG